MFNMVDLTLHVLGIAYSILRCIKMDRTLTTYYKLTPDSKPDKHTLPYEEYNYLAFIAFFNVALTTLSAVKTMNLLRVFPDFGKLVQLVG